MTRTCDASIGSTPATSPLSAEEYIGGPSKPVRTSGPGRCSYNEASSQIFPGTAGSHECGGLRTDRTSAASRAERESGRRPRLRSQQPGPGADGYETGLGPL